MPHQYSQIAKYTEYIHWAGTLLKLNSIDVGLVMFYQVQITHVGRFKGAFITARAWSQGVGLTFRRAAPIRS